MTIAQEDGVSLKLHVLKQRDIPKDAKLPLIVYIQGSTWGWKGPQDTFSYVPQLSELAKNGYVVATVQHRTSSQSIFPSKIKIPYIG
jgi:dipeptidyl aminopeptidase/acylaminoacyl peptidase